MNAEFNDTYFGNCPFCGELLGFGHIPALCDHAPKAAPVLLPLDYGAPAKTFLSIAHQIGELVEEKNAAYGSSFAKAGDALRLLYPDGIKPSQLDDALLIARIWDKLQRIATDRDALGESPYRDIAGYGILGTHLHELRKQNEESKRCASASGPAAETPSTRTDGSVRPSADGR